jgi:glucose/arabinose dehydrogenase
MKFLKTLFKALLVIIVVAGGGLGYLISQNAWPINIPVLGTLFGAEADEEHLDEVIQLPEDYAFSVYATGLGKARMLLALPGGDLLVSTPAVGAVQILSPDGDGDGKADSAQTLLEGLSRPTGMDFHDGWLYIAEDNAIGRAPYDPATRELGAYTQIVTGLGVQGNHWTKTIGIGPDAMLYLVSGSTCNICEEEDPRRAAMMRFNLDGTDGKIIALGLRNSVGFDWAPDGTLYATENARDLLGNDFPPEELNLIEEGKFYGWPYVNGFGVLDPDFGPGHEDKLETSTDPAHGFRPHNAPLGMAFVGGKGIPEDYQGTALVALHGSWNRSEKDGYKVVSLHFEEGEITEKDFMTGFLVGGTVIGRPVDVEQDEDGALYVSDDFTGTVYKLVHGGVQGDVVRTTGAATQGEIKTFAADEIAAGEALFNELGCLSCHAPDVEGAVRLEGLAQKLSAAQVIEILEYPQPPMPTYDLSDEEKRALVAWLLSAY